MRETAKIHIGLSVSFVPGRLRSDYESLIAKVLSAHDYEINELRLLSNRIELSLSGPFKPPNVIEKELTDIGAHIEKELLTDAFPKCFVLMPFDKEDLDIVYRDYIKPSIEKLTFQCLRDDDIFGSNVIMEDIITLIKESTILIADLTYKNPNVFYELGLAHAMKKKVLLLAQCIDDVPFDLRHRRVCLYEYSPKGCKKLENDIVDHLKAMLLESN